MHPRQFRLKHCLHTQIKMLIWKKLDIISDLAKNTKQAEDYKAAVNWVKKKSQGKSVNARPFTFHLIIKN